MDPRTAGTARRQRWHGRAVAGAVAGMFVLAACGGSGTETGAAPGTVRSTRDTGPSASTVSPDSSTPDLAGTTSATTGATLGSAGSTTTVPPPTTPATAGGVTSPPPPPPSPAPTKVARTTSLAVATTTRAFVDDARNRQLQTTIYYPARAPASSPRPIGVPVVDAPADAAPASGSFPLIVFAHGYRLPGDGYDRVLKAVASAGYVVASPEFPHNTAHGGDGLRSDITNQPADLSFVADRMISAGNETNPRTPPIADPGRIGVGGHSDGGLTATAFGYGLQFRDERVAAVVSLTGGVGLFPGAFYPANSPPVLAAHTRDDATNPYSASANLFRGVPSGRARYLLSIETGGHIDPYMFAQGRVDLGDAMAAFYDLTLRGDTTAEARLQSISTRDGFTLEVG